MGWAIHYKATNSERVLTDQDAAEICAWLEPWTAKLHNGCESMWMKPRDGGLWGFTKVEHSSDRRADFVTVLRAIRALAVARPELRFSVSDDFYVTQPTEPISIGDPEALVDRLDREFAKDPIRSLERMFRSEH